MFAIIGIVGTLLLAISGFFQLMKTIRDGNADGLSGVMIICWLLGFSLLFCYTLICYPTAWVLLANYGFNFFMAAVFCHFKFKKK